MSEYKLIRAWYNYDCVWDEWTSPELFKKCDDKDQLGFVYGCPRNNGKYKWIENKVQGEDAALQRLTEMQETIDLAYEYWQNCSIWLKDKLSEEKNYALMAMFEKLRSKK